MALEQKLSASWFQTAVLKAVPLVVAFSQGMQGQINDKYLQLISRLSGRVPASPLSFFVKGIAFFFLLNDSV